MRMLVVLFLCLSLKIYGSQGPPTGSLRQLHSNEAQLYQNMPSNTVPTTGKSSFDDVASVESDEANVLKGMLEDIRQKSQENRAERQRLLALERKRKPTLRVMSSQSWSEKIYTLCCTWCCCKKRDASVYYLDDE